MRKALLCLVLPVLLFYSCKKDHSSATKPAQPTYKLDFNVSGFTQQIVGSTSTKQQTNSLKTNALTGLAATSDFLYYRVYDFTSGAIVHQLNQDSTASNFGNIVDYLPSGKYVIVFVASNSKGIINNFGIPTAGMAIQQGQTEWSDTFCKSDTVIVSGQDISQNVSLPRVVGQLTIKLGDVFPANAVKITTFISEELNAFSFATSTWTPGHSVQLTFNDSIPAALKVNAGYQRSIFMMNNFRPFQVTITCYDSGGKILAQSVIPGVSVAWNTQTILTGNLFGSGVGYHVGLNQPWDPNPINIQF